MPLIWLIIYLVVIGMVMWLVNTYLPIAEPYKTILNVIVLVVVVLWLVSMFVPLGGGPRIGTVR